MSEKKIGMRDMSEEGLRTVAGELNQLKDSVAHMGDAAFELWSELHDIEAAILKELKARA